MEKRESYKSDKINQVGSSLMRNEICAPRLVKKSDMPQSRVGDFFNKNLKNRFFKSEYFLFKSDFFYLFDFFFKVDTV